MIDDHASLPGGEADVALAELERALAMIEVRLGPPTEWRRLQLGLAVELYGFGQHELAYMQARRAQTPLADIAPEERAVVSALSIGALRHQIRKLRDLQSLRSRAAARHAA